MISLKSVMELDLFFERLLRFLRAPDTVQGEIVIFDSLSPIGIYIRRARLEARKMDFSQVSDLWSAFQSYLGELASPVGPADRWSLLSETEDLRDIRFYKSIDMRSTPFCAAVMPKWNSQKYLHKQLEYIESESPNQINHTRMSTKYVMKSTLASLFRLQFRRPLNKYSSTSRRNLASTTPCSCRLSRQRTSRLPWRVSTNISTTMML